MTYREQGSRLRSNKFSAMQNSDNTRYEIMSTFAQLRDCGEDPIVIFEELFHTALGKLLPELAKAPWYVREREVVNLFVFGHLIPQFQKKNLDISQLGIEVAVQKLPKIIVAESDGAKSSKQAREMLGRYADIVVWPHAEATLWQTCKPLVQVEWKHISCRTERPPDIKKVTRMTSACCSTTGVWFV